MPDLSVAFTRISLLIGDIAHNFRSALDHLAYQLALKNTSGKIVHPEWVQFPIVDWAVDFPSARGKALSEIDPAHQAIIERFQPYNRIAKGLSISMGRGWYFHSFAVLRDLSNADKRRLLNPVMIPPGSLGDFISGETMLVFYAAMMREAAQMTRNFDPIVLGA